MHEAEDKTLEKSAGRSHSDWMKPLVRTVGRVTGRLQEFLVHSLMVPLVLLVLYLVNLAVLTASPLICLAWFHDRFAGYMGLLPSWYEQVGRSADLSHIHIPAGLLLLLFVAGLLVLLWLAVFVGMLIQGISRFWFARVLRQTYRRTAVLWRHLLILLLPLAWFVVAGIFSGGDGVREEVTEVAAMTTISHLGVILVLFGITEYRQWRAKGAREHAVGCVTAAVLAPLLIGAAIHAVWQVSDASCWFVAWVGATLIETILRWRSYKKYYNTIMRHAVEEDPA